MHLKVVHSQDEVDLILELRAIRSRIRFLNAQDRLTASQLEELYLLTRADDRADEGPNLSLVHSRPLTMVEKLRARVKRGVDMAKVCGKGEYYTHRRI